MIPILTKKICKLFFFQIVVKFFSWVGWLYCGYSKHPFILSLPNDNKIMFIGCIYQNIFEKVDLPRGWGSAASM